MGSVPWMLKLPPQLKYDQQTSHVDNQVGVCREAEFQTPLRNLYPRVPGDADTLKSLRSTALNFSVNSGKERGPKITVCGFSGHFEMAFGELSHFTTRYWQKAILAKILLTFGNIPTEL